MTIPLEIKHGKFDRRFLWADLCWLPLFVVVYTPNLYELVALYLRVPNSGTKPVPFISVTCKKKDHKMSRGIIAMLLCVAYVYTILHILIYICIHIYIYIHICPYQIVGHVSYLSIFWPYSNLMFYSEKTGSQNGGFPLGFSNGNFP